jgi:hypothetical protein
MDNMLKFVARIAAALLATFALVGCIDIDIDDVGDDVGSTTDPSGTGGESDTTDTSEGESTTDTDTDSSDTTGDTTGDTTDSGEDPEFACCDCASPPSCEAWTLEQGAATCEADGGYFCELDEQGTASECFEQCGETGAYCCTCPDQATSEYECWPWSPSDIEGCTVTLAGTLNQETHWCPLDTQTCLAACG